MNLDFSTVSLGNVLTVLTILLSQWAMHKQNIKRLTAMELKVGLMWKSFAKKFHVDENFEKEED